MKLIMGTLSKYIKDVHGIKHFIGDPKDKEDFTASTVLAGACKHFKEDDSEEIYSRNIRSCYNCRYRRWAQRGFNCCKDFVITTS